MRSRFLIELTTPEIEGYLDNGDLAFLPVGSVEMHGPHLPTGTDTFIAKAFALRLAEEANGLVLPEIVYTWAGATDGFAGTISVAPEEVMQLVESVCRRAVKMAFRRIVILNVHGPGRMFLQLAVRRFFENHHVPVLYVEPGDPLSDEANDLFAGEYAGTREAALLLAALEILGKGDLYSQEELAYQEEPQSDPECYQKLRPCVAGFFMQDPRRHACPSKLISLQRGREYFRLQVRDLLAKLDHLAEYVEIVKTQKNKGWWSR